MIELGVGWRWGKLITTTLTTLKKQNKKDCVRPEKIRKEVKKKKTQQ